MPKLSLAKLERHLYAAADILRREGMDAATYKDFIFGMLFLKRCSDVFDAETDSIVGQFTARGMIVAEAKERYGDNPDYHDDFFVPPAARWPHLLERLNAADVAFGSVLDKALAALSERNTSLEHVLDHISFMRMQSNKRIVSDDACKDLVRHFTKYRLRNEDFQFTDLLGSAYEFLINMFAESAGKKGGDFYTPRDVIRLMVRILAPTPGLSVYDPTCGSGGMLIITREHIEQSGGDPSNLRLCGQVNDASAWSICKLNMLLHGIRGADIQLQDTLLHPMHRDAGELERFDRVIANPPFSQNYTRSNMEFPERFRWGWCPTSGKKGDLMFAQHMLAACKDRGAVCTVMPHGVLFRGGAEKEIRSKFLKEDLIEAIISLPPNLFYGAGIPACLLVMRPNRTGRFPNPNKPQSRRGKVLFINADAEYYAGRAQNYLQPRHIEKIASTFERYEDIPAYARVVDIEEISDAANDFNLNIRRYVDNSPPPEPHDVRAHLIGGVPSAEIEANRPLFDSLGFDPGQAFMPRNGDDSQYDGPPSPSPASSDSTASESRRTGLAARPRYHDFTPAITQRADIASLVAADAGVAARTQQLTDSLRKWWKNHAKRLAALPTRRDLNAVRSEMLASFTKALLPVGVLDRFTLAGVVAMWWNETLPDFKTLIENGFAGVIDGWIDAIADAVDDEGGVGPAFDPFAHKLVLHTMADYLQQIDDAKAEIARLKGEKEAFEQSNPPDDADEDELAKWNYVKDLEQQFKDIRSENRDSQSGLKRLERYAAKKKATDADRQALADAQAALAAVFENIARLEADLAPYERIKADLAAARARFRELTAKFVEELRTRSDALSDELKQKLVLELFAQDLQAGLNAALVVQRQSLIRFLERLWDNYAVPLSAIQRERELLQTTLTAMMGRLGYA